MRHRLVEAKLNARAGVRRGLELQHEQQSIDHNQPFLPKARCKPVAFGAHVEICRSIEHGLQKAFDGVARLQSQILGDAGLGQPGCIEHIGQCGKSIWRDEGKQHTVGLRREVLRAPACRAPASEIVIWLSGPARIAEQQAQFIAVGQRPARSPSASNTRWALRVGLKR